MSLQHPIVDTGSPGVKGDSGLNGATKINAAFEDVGASLDNIMGRLPALESGKEFLQEEVYKSLRTSSRFNTIQSKFAGAPVNGGEALLSVVQLDEVSTIAIGYLDDAPAAANRAALSIMGGYENQIVHFMNKADIDIRVLELGGSGLVDTDAKIPARSKGILVRNNLGWGSFAFNSYDSKTEKPLLTLKKTAAQAITGNTTVNFITWETATSNLSRETLFNPATPTRIIIPKAVGSSGYVRVNMGVVWADNQSGYRALELWRNGVVVEEIPRLSAAAHYVPRMIYSSPMIQVNPGDYLEAWTMSSATTNIISDSRNRTVLQLTGWY